MYMKYMIFQVTKRQSSDREDSIPYSNESNDTHASRPAAVTVCK